MSKKLLVAGVMLALVATIVGGVAVQSAGAQSMTLCQTVQALVAAGVIAPDKVAAANAAAGCGSTTTTGTTVTTTTFSRSLTLGSTGADVSALQSWLIAQGYSIPAGATGFFGAQTQAAVKAYQLAKGISPATGFFGPITRASVTTTTTTTTTTTGGTAACPAGFTCTATVACPTGYTCTSNTGVSTSGQEGTLTVDQSSAGLPSSVYEGNTKVGVLGFKVTAKNSDISVQRVSVDLSTSTSIYNKVASKIYVMDGSTVLASSDLNSTTVTKDSATPAHYYIDLTGMNVVVAKDASKIFTIALDINSSVDSSYRSAAHVYPIALYEGTNGAVRGVDGAGLNEYAGTGSVTRNLAISSALVDSASLTLSTDSSTPDATSIIAADGSNNDEKDGVTLLKFDLQAKKDDVKVTDLTVAADSTGGGGATLQTVYLYDGSTQLDSASLSDGIATFSNIDTVIAKDTTKTFTVKADVRTAGVAVTTWVATTTATYVTAENSNGDSVSPTGSATGNGMTFTKTGSQFTLISKSTGNASTINDPSYALSTTTQSYNFKIQVAAIGGAVTLGGSASTTPAFGTATATAVNIYKDSIALTTLGSRTLTVSYFAPDSGVTTTGTGASTIYTIAEGQTATFDVTYSLKVGTYDAGNYAIGIKGILENGAVSNFMDGLSAWRTSGVQLP